jgi:hypothetical protein
VDRKSFFRFFRFRRAKRLQKLLRHGKIASVVAIERVSVIPEGLGTPPEADVFLFN